MQARVALIHPWFGWGGGEAVLAWTIQALAGRYDIWVLTHTPFTVQQMNAFYGTRVRQNEITIHPSPYAGIVRRAPGVGLFGPHLAMRYIKPRAFEFDLLFSTSNEMDLGRRGIQYIHYPALAEEAATVTGAVRDTWYRRSPFVRRAYTWLCESLSGYSRERMRSNITLANSRWTAKLVEQVYNIRAMVVYPPVPRIVSSLPWAKREDGFICVGRIAPEKRIERAIAILSEVRRQYREVHMHIVGPSTNSVYAERIKRLAQIHRDWVFVEGALPRIKLRELIARHRYGLHAMPSEHFGIGVAEMVKGGCLVFVPSSGGQVEIVGGEESLTFHDEPEAVEKIRTVLGDEELQHRLRDHLAKHAEVFSVETFMSRVNEVVEAALGETGRD